LFACQNTSQNLRAQALITEPGDPIVMAGLAEHLSLSGPYESGNLQVFLIHSAENNDVKEYITLEQAMKANLVKVHESGSVSELTISNKSDKYIFVHSGDIVKGGKQDRTMQQDFVLAPGDKNIPISSFCVESGRWQSRGNADVRQFDSSGMMLSSRRLKYAANYSKIQGEVWENVRDQQTKLNENMSGAFSIDSVNVNSAMSATSLQLSLENKDLTELRKKIREDFKDILNDKEDVIGFAYAINGEVYGADIYLSHQLFSSLWKKLMESAIVESISEYDSTKLESKATKEDVVKLMSQAAEGKKNEDDRAKNTMIETTINEADDAATFRTYDKTGKERKVIHQNFIKID